MQKVFMKRHPPVLSTVTSGTYCLANDVEALLVECGLKMFISIPESLKVFFIHLEASLLILALKVLYETRKFCIITPVIPKVLLSKLDWFPSTIEAIKSLQ